MEGTKLSDRALDVKQVLCRDGLKVQELTELCRKGDGSLSLCTVAAGYIDGYIDNVFFKSNKCILSRARAQ